jgi:ethanolamine utilization protein EutN
MYIANVLGNVVATTKDEGLTGEKLLIVQPMTPAYEAVGCPVVAIDTVGAGFGDKVLVAKGSSARSIFEKSAPIDAAIVAIIDSVEIY